MKPTCLMTRNQAAVLDGAERGTIAGHGRTLRTLVEKGWAACLFYHHDKAYADITDSGRAALAEHKRRKARS
jgi:hypothetical protein